MNWYCHHEIANERKISGYSHFINSTIDFKIFFTKEILTYTVGGIAYICFKWFQITADAHPGVSWVSNDQKFCEKLKNTHCQVDHPAKIE